LQKFTACDNISTQIMQGTFFLFDTHSAYQKHFDYLWR